MIDFLQKTFRTDDIALRIAWVSCIASMAVFYAEDKAPEILTPLGFFLLFVWGVSAVYGTLRTIKTDNEIKKNRIPY